jgi:SWI/SNF related-matrix-associated actin-dependent regulator of chromatin subfamily C
VVSTDSGDPNLDTSANKKTEKDSGSDDDVDDDADWTDQETLTLLEAVERHGEDWSAVSSRVATKTVEQCVKKFVRIPIEDAFVERLDGGENSDKNHDDTSVPFAQAPNPVMANVAFLATCVCPRVAAAAAKAALVSLSQAADPGGDADNADQDLGPSPSVTSEQVVAAAGAGVAAAATHAKLLADRDGHEIEKLAVGVVEMQMRKIELKLRQIEDLDKGLDRERLAVAKMFEQIANERENFERNKAEAEQRAKQAEEEELKRRAAEAEAAAAAAAAAAKAEQERRSIAAMLAASKPPTK